MARWRERWISATKQFQRKPHKFLTFVARWIRDIDFRTNRRSRGEMWLNRERHTHTHTHTHTQTNPTTVTLAAHACRGLINTLCQFSLPLSSTWLLLPRVSPWYRSRVCDRVTSTLLVRVSLSLHTHVPPLEFFFLLQSLSPTTPLPSSLPPSFPPFFPLSSHVCIYSVTRNNELAQWVYVENIMSWDSSHKIWELNSQSFPFSVPKPRGSPKSPTGHWRPSQKVLQSSQAGSNTYLPYNTTRAGASLIDTKCTTVVWFTVWILNDIHSLWCRSWKMHSLDIFSVILHAMYTSNIHDPLCVLINVNTFTRHQVTVMWQQWQ